MKYYIKIVLGFREDQFVTIPMQEAHKAYYLFENPEARGIFSNGTAVIGKNIQTILPDFNATMGYNPTYRLEDYDWNSIRNAGVETKMRLLIQKAKDVASLCEKNPEVLQKRLEDVINLLSENENGIFLLDSKE